MDGEVKQSENRTLRVLKSRKGAAVVNTDFDFIFASLLLIKPGSVCILWNGSHRARLVRVIKTVKLPGSDYAFAVKSYLSDEPDPPVTRVDKDELTLLTNEMEILAWASK